MPSNHLILCGPLLLLPSIFPSTRVYSSESALHIRWPKYWSFSFSISPSNEYSELISFRIDWFHFLAVQGLSRVFSTTTFQKHQFFGAQPSLWSNSHICTWLLEKPSLWLYRPLLAKWCVCCLIHCLGERQDLIVAQKRQDVPRGGGHHGNEETPWGLCEQAFHLPQSCFHLGLTAAYSLQKVHGGLDSVIDF